MLLKYALFMVGCFIHPKYNSHWLGLSLKAQPCCQPGTRRPLVSTHCSQEHTHAHIHTQSYHLCKKSDLCHLLRDTGWPDPARALVLHWSCLSLGPPACTKKRMEVTGKGQGMCVAGRRWLLRGQLWGLFCFEFDICLKKSIPHWI